MDVEPEIVCVDCGGRCFLLSHPEPDEGFAPGDIVAYRCSDCLDRWDLVVPEMDEEQGRHPTPRVGDWYPSSRPPSRADPGGPMDVEIVAPAVDAAKARRADLHSILIDLEARIAAAAPGREESWSDDVRRELDRLAEAFTEHVEATEGPGGLFEHVRRRAPRLDNGCSRLLQDHSTIATELAAAVAALDQDVAAAREATLSLLAHLARHRQQGADLIYEAYAVDLGGSD